MNENQQIENQLLDEVYSLLGSTQTETIMSLIEAHCEKHNISQRQLSQILGFQRKSLQRLLDGETKKIDLLTFLKINHFLGIGLDKLMQVYVSSLGQEKIKEMEDARVRTFIVENFDLDGLKKIGFLNSTSDFNLIHDRIVQFFQLETIYDYQDGVYAYFSRTKNQSSDNMRTLWVKSAHAQFSRIDNPNNYNRNQLIELIPNIRPYTRHENTGLLTVVKALYNIGITVIYQKYIPKLQVRGATFIVKEKPCIVLTDWRNYDSIWFTLMHELHHVLYDFDKLSSTKYHLSGEPDVLLLEEEANEFAKEYLFSDEKMKYISNFIDSHGVVEEYAKKQKIHQSIIYSFYCWKKKETDDSDIGYKKFSKHFVKADVALNSLNYFDWSEDNIGEIAKRLQNTLSKY
ncbi:MAG: HTH-type transcriptional regulator/antitoxin HigA [Arenicella sp.]|jgi:HTH-type transcriptional regulator/antitoxin HigA